MSDRLQAIFDSEAAIEAFKAHCFMNTSEEMCGLFVVKAGVMTFVPCDNIAYDKKNSFLIHPSELVSASDNGDVVAVGHSHVNGTSEPSMEDRVHSTNCMLPFVIFHPIALTMNSFEPNGQPAPLIGRQWAYGVSDCYTLARDYYRSRGVELKDYVRNDPKYLIRESLFTKYFEENGFHVVDDGPRVNDAILIQIMADIPNHIAVMIEDNIILHHLQSRLSCREPWGGYWKRHAAMILRHEKWL